MGILGREIRAVQNPALGAVLIGAATQGFTDAGAIHAGMPMPLAFLVLPIVLHAGTNKFVGSTLRKSGLRYFADKFSQSKNAESDLLLSIQRRAVSMRALTFEALDILLRSRLAILDTKKAQLSSTDKLIGVLKGVHAEKELCADSGKLGYWFGLLSAFELTTILKVAF